MKITLITVFFFLYSIILFGQNISVSGYLYDDEGEPLIGASVSVKGTSTGTTSNIDGYYILHNVDINATLQIAYLGMTTKYIPVKELVEQENYPVKEPVFSSGLLSGKDAPGVAFLNENTPTYSYFPGIDDIAKFNLKDNIYTFKRVKASRPTGYQLQVTTSFGWENITQLPKLQNKYSQGETDGTQLQWYGPDRYLEVFSWGPAINTLEYDGSSYPYDNNGRLVSIGTGNGTPANAYDSSDFFGTGLHLQNEISLKAPGYNKDNVVSINLKQHSRTSPIPNSKYESYTVGLGMDEIRFGKGFRGNANVVYNYSNGDLLTRGSNMATIMSSVLTTPVTFDNANGLSRKNATKDKSSWLLDNGTRRSYSPIIINNPYALINELPDNENMKHLLSSIGLKYKNTSDRGFSGDMLASYDRQWNYIINGVPYFLEYLPSERNDKISDINVKLNSSYRLFNDHNKDLAFNLYYNFRHQDEEVWRDFLSNSDDNFLQRNTHEIKYGVNYNNEHFYLTFNNLHYFSTTAPASSYTNLFPYLGLKYRIEPYQLWEHDTSVSIYGNISRSMHESSLVYRNSSVLSTKKNANSFKNYYEYTDIFQPQNLTPETYLNIELGSDISVLNNKLYFNLVYFNNTTRDFIAPVLSGTTPSLQNVARTQNTGGTIGATYQNYFNRNTTLHVSLLFSKSRSRVKSMYFPDEYFPLAGFSDIASVLAEGKPIGAIYGSTYQRNDNGEMIIGNEGFPLVDQSMKMIGDPTPDFVTTLKPVLHWKKFQISFLFEYKHGGDKWNGTNAALDYYGMSEKTGNQRNMKRNVFYGVDLSGNENTQMIDFYNPKLPLYQNRWVRYGFAGVGEEYIEDASYFRLSDVTLSYTLRNIKRMKALTFSFSAQNLLLVTPYSGVEPTSSLFGYTMGAGLDLFNLPSTRSYTFSIALEL